MFCWSLFSRSLPSWNSTHLICSIVCSSSLPHSHPGEEVLLQRLQSYHLLFQSSSRLSIPRNRYEESTPLTSQLERMNSQPLRHQALLLLWLLWHSHDHLVPSEEQLAVPTLHQNSNKRHHHSVQDFLQWS